MSKRRGPTRCHHRHRRGASAIICSRRSASEAAQSLTNWRTATTLPRPSSRAIHSGRSQARNNPLEGSIIDATPSDCAGRPESFRIETSPGSRGLLLMHRVYCRQQGGRERTRASANRLRDPRAARCQQRFREHHTARKPAATCADDTARRPPQAWVTGSDTCDVRAPARSRPFLSVPVRSSNLGRLQKRRVGRHLGRIRTHVDLDSHFSANVWHTNRPRTPKANAPPETPPAPPPATTSQTLPRPTANRTTERTVEQTERTSPQKRTQPLTHTRSPINRPASLRTPRPRSRCSAGP